MFPSNFILNCFKVYISIKCEYAKIKNSVEQEFWLMQKLQGGNNVHWISQTF